jgi:oligosaccharide repeat unit polymerase
VLLSVGIIGIALMMIVPVMQSARYEKYSEETSVFGSKTLAYYSSVNAFTVWWAENDTIKCEPLKYTFSGLHNVIFKDREVGLYKSKTLIGTKNSKEIETNVYTILRGLIEDYTYPGAILLMCLVGFFYTLIYYKVKQGNILLFPLLSAFMAILLHSVLVSIFNFNVILIGWVIAFILVVFIFKITIPKTHE